MMQCGTFLHINMFNQFRKSFVKGLKCGPYVLKVNSFVSRNKLIWSPVLPASGLVCLSASDSGGCAYAPCQEAVCATDDYCCTTLWDTQCAASALDQAACTGVCFEGIGLGQPDVCVCIFFMSIGCAMISDNLLDSQELYFWASNYHRIWSPSGWHAYSLRTSHLRSLFEESLPWHQPCFFLGGANSLDLSTTKHKWLKWQHSGQCTGIVNKYNDWSSCNFKILSDISIKFWNRWCLPLPGLQSVQQLKWRGRLCVSPGLYRGVLRCHRCALFAWYYALIWKVLRCSGPYIFIV